MREFWLTNENEDKWSLGTSSESPLFSPTNLITKTTDSYWEGQRTFFQTNSRDQMVTITANVVFKNGMNEFQEFKRWCSVSSTLWLHSKRDGCEARKCKVSLSVTSVSELYGRAIIVNVSFARLTPWRGDEKTINFKSSSSVSSLFIDLPKDGDIPTPFRITIYFMDVTGTNSGIIISSYKNGSDVDRISSYSFGATAGTNLTLCTEEGNQYFTEFGGAHQDLFPTINFAKDSFFQIGPDIPKLRLYDSKATASWSGTLVIFPQYGEA